MRGFVYVLSNRAMPGLLKVGYTTRSIFDRLNELNSTGVPTSFVIEFYFEIDDAPRGEILLHHALGRYHYEKEFFKVSVSKVVEESKKILSSEIFIVHGIHGRAKDCFLSVAEQDCLNRQAETALAKKKSEDEQKRRKEVEVDIIGEKFLNLCPNINAILKGKSILGSAGSSLRAIAAGLLGATIILATIADEISPIPFKDGENLSKNLSETEIDLFRQFYSCVSKLEKLNSFEKFGRQWFNQAKPHDYVTESGIAISGLLKGVFRGLDF